MVLLLTEFILNGTSRKGKTVIFSPHIHPSRMDDEQREALTILHSIHIRKDEPDQGLGPALRCCSIHSPKDIDVIEEYCEKTKEYAEIRKCKHDDPS